LTDLKPSRSYLNEKQAHHQKNNENQNPLKSLRAIMNYIELQRVQVIWINALREGMMKIESRLDKIA